MIGVMSCPQGQGGIEHKQHFQSDRHGLEMMIRFTNRYVLSQEKSRDEWQRALPMSDANETFSRRPFPWAFLEQASDQCLLYCQAVATCESRERGYSRDAIPLTWNERESEQSTCAALSIRGLQRRPTATRLST